MRLQRNEPTGALECGGMAMIIIKANLIMIPTHDTQSVHISITLGHTHVVHVIGSGISESSLFLPA